MLIGIGDPVVGPLVGLFYDAPSTPEQLAGAPDLAPAHSHPCDNFRIVMKGELWVGQERYHHGQYRLQKSMRIAIDGTLGELHARLYWYAQEYPESQLPLLRTASHVSSNDGNGVRCPIWLATTWSMEMPA